MKTLIIHDNGEIIATMAGEYENPGCIVADVPDGYDVTGVNVETGEAIIEPRPATEAERTAAIEKQLMAQAGTHEGSYEDPIPFVYGMAVEKGKHYSFGGEIYIWAAADCSACVWLPDSGIWQWQAVLAPGEYPEWVQPLGTSDAYNTGDIVSHGEELWQSDVDGNVWEPGVYGWTEYEVM